MYISPSPQREGWRILAPSILFGGGRVRMYSDKRSIVPLAFSRYTSTEQSYDGQGCGPSKKYYFIHTEIFASNFALWKNVFGFYFDQSERRHEFLTREKIVSSNHKPQFKRIVFSRAFSRSSRVALSGSFDKILFFRCTRVVRNSNIQVIKS